MPLDLSGSPFRLDGVLIAVRSLARSRADDGPSPKLQAAAVCSAPTNHASCALSAAYRHTGSVCRALRLHLAGPLDDCFLFPERNTDEVVSKKKDGLMAGPAEPAGGERRGGRSGGGVGPGGP